MQISEAKLRQIVLEEVQLRILDVYITEELHRLLEEEGEEVEEDDVQAYKDAARAQIASYAKKALIPAALAAALIGYVNQETTSHSDAQAALSQARIEASTAATETDEFQLQRFSQQLNNQYAWRWGKGNDAVVWAPAGLELEDGHVVGADEKVTVLPPSYSIAVKALQDKKINAERIEQGLPPIQRYGEIDPDMRAKDYRQAIRDKGGIHGKGNVDDDISNFLKVHQGEFVDAMDVLGDHEELEVVPGSGVEQMIIMVNPDDIDGSTYLPAIGMTAGDYYNLQYGQYMGSDEKAALDIPDEEMIVTPDDDSEMLDPDLATTTAKHAQKLRMKESMPRWRNYKNRKKMLA